MADLTPRSSRSRPTLPPRLAFEAIGTRWEIDTAEPIDADLQGELHETIARFDATWSRFRDDSLVADIARRPGSWVFPAEAPALFDLYRRLYEATDGAVSPLVGRALETLGYDRAYSLRPTGRPGPVPAWDEAFAWDGSALTTVRPVTLDVGAAGKGYLVDLVGELLVARGARDVLVDASGDIRRWGEGSIRVALEHPADATKAIARLVEELLVEQLARLLDLRRVAGPKALVDLEQRFFVAVGRVFLQRVEDEEVLGVAKDLDIAKLIVDAKNLSKALDTVQQSFKTLSDQADDYVARAAKLGISSKEVLNALATNFDKTVADSIKGIEDPYQAAYDTLIKDQQARLDYAKKIGADITNVEKLNLLEQKQLMEQYGKDTTAALQQLSTDLKKWLDGELLGGNSSLTPYGQFTEAQSQFQKAVDSARSAGAGADISSVTSLADQLLGLGKNTLGGATSDYSTLEAMVRSTIQQLGKQLGLPGFATGGSFMVGGNGGTDSQLVAFKATPGEHVQISTPGQAMQSREGLTTLVVTMQREMQAVHKELKLMNRNMSSSRTYDLVVRR